MSKISVLSAAAGVLILSAGLAFASGSGSGCARGNLAQLEEDKIIASMTAKKPVEQASEAMSTFDPKDPVIFEQQETSVETLEPAAKILKK